MMQSVEFQQVFTYVQTITAHFISSRIVINKLSLWNLQTVSNALSTLRSALTQSSRSSLSSSVKFAILIKLSFCFVYIFLWQLLLTLWHPAGFGDFRQKKHLNARGFADEYLRSCSL